MVFNSISSSMGVCLLARPRRHCLSASISSYEKRICEWYFSLRGYGISEACLRYIGLTCFWKVLVKFLNYQSFGKDRLDLDS